MDSIDDKTINVTKVELDSDDGTISELNLLYWSVISNSAQSVECCVDLLRKRNLLSTEINKQYPNATILHVMMDEEVMNDENAALIYRLLINCDELENGTLCHRFENRNLFDSTLSGDIGDPFLVLFNSTVRCDVFFMEYLGFKRGESEEKRIEKYRKWGGNILFNVIRMKSVDAVELGLRLLKSYDYILKYELSQINKHSKTLLQYAINNAGK